MTTSIPHPDNLPKIFGANVRARRKSAGISQLDLADQMNGEGYLQFEQSILSRTEAGKRPVGLFEAATLARLLDTTVDELLTPTTKEA